ncbi:MAG: hypothetical protein A3J46_00330 [Candidatus Yanofskybacteria bacterium RIFCSPHIGHO2_02_FULL_41_11]|uniref:Triosephosphate isomerase n=1 Tax=Candidatus Yanofskybacteria bacterium RIFCSPHIGHO2_02_FULL_41_11 TaxID=1802675 RepID=A0A1F8F9H2_9BACT|nr:MAG: hypothetical protein A3J46_00330 [Candidatus Yanofskybacteria bacterium RIFCSPHIGHO2_02_FULL_41_11]
MSKKYIIANWKILPASWGEAQQILDSTSEYFTAEGLKEFSVVVCPPFVFIEEVGKLLSATSLGNYIELGAQDVVDTLPQLARYVIVGHSDRRWKLGETDAVVNQKLKAALQKELTPIVCIGEKSREGDYKKFLEDQVEATFSGLSGDEVEKCLIAYEPVWAISTTPGAKPDTPESALESINIIKNTLALNFSLSTFRFLYGGSITSKNAKEFLSLPEFSGVLVGGASVDREEFVKILKLV